MHASGVVAPPVRLRRAAVQPTAQGSTAPGPRWLTGDDLPLTIGYLGLLVYSFVTISYKLNIADIAAVAAIVGIIAQGRFKLGKPVLWFSAFTAWAALASIQGLTPAYSMTMIYVELKLILIMWVAVNAIQTRGQLQWYLLTYLATFGTFGTLMSLWFYARGIRHVGRLVGYSTYSNSNDIAALCLLAVGTSLGVAAAARRNWIVRLAALGSAAAGTAAIILSQSRGALLALLLSGSPLMLKLIRRNPKVLLYVAAAGMVAAAAAPESVWKRFGALRNFSTSGNLRTVDAEGSAEERWALVGAAIAATKDNPILGVGFSAWGAATRIYIPERAGKDTHNTYLNISAETGLVGLGLYLALVGSVLMHGWRTTKRIEQAAKAGKASLDRAMLIRFMTAALLAYQLASFFGTNIRLNFPFLFMGILWAACEVELHAIGAPGVVNRSLARARGLRGGLSRSRTGARMPQRLLPN